MAGEIFIPGPGGQSAVCYAHIFDSNGRRGNNDDEVFENFAAANYADYVVTLTEDGSTGIFRGDMPEWITPGTFQALLYVQSGGSPANGDTAGAAQSIHWNGVGETPGDTPLGALSGSQMRDYIVRSGLVRDDLDTELYDALTDTILEMEQDFQFGEREADTPSTDTIGALGEYKLDLETDHGQLIDVVLIDSTYSKKLTRISKTLFDLLYPDPTSEQYRGYPEYYCVFGRQVQVGPGPDKTSYVYHLIYSQRLTTAVDASTNPVPFSAEYREVLKDGTLARLFNNLKNFDAADRFGALYEKGRERIKTKERREKRGAIGVAYNDC